MAASQVHVAPSPTAYSGYANSPLVIVGALCQMSPELDLSLLCLTAAAFAITTAINTNSTPLRIIIIVMLCFRFYFW